MLQYRVVSNMENIRNQIKMGSLEDFGQQKLNKQGSLIFLLGWTLHRNRTYVLLHLPTCKSEYVGWG